MPAHKIVSVHSSFAILIFLLNETCKRGGRLQALVQTIRSFD
jgi:hypothetical protein